MVLQSELRSLLLMCMAIVSTLYCARMTWKCSISHHSTQSAVILTASGAALRVYQETLHSFISVLSQFCFDSGSELFAIASHAIAIQPLHLKHLLEC